MSEKEYNPRMHTVEHLLNGFFSKTFNCSRAFSTHIERKKSKVDIKFNRELTDAEHRGIEDGVNDILAQNIEVIEEYLSYDEASHKFDLSRIPDNEKGSDIRIVHIGEYDSCPCIGPHLSNTQECDGRLKIISSDYSEEKGILRIRFKVIAIN